MTRRLLFVALAAILACSKKQPAPAPPPAEAADSAAGQEAAGAAPDEDEVKPVYSAFEGAALPVAQKLCAALHDLPGQRRAACCKGGTGISFASECIKIVSAAVRSGGVQLDAAAVDRCVAAQEKALQGCSWVGGNEKPVIAECADLFVGHRKPGEVCRSSLECGEGLRCQGVGPLNPGRCGPSRGPNQVCLTAVDSLAIYTRARLESQHPECTGYCGNRKCEVAKALGAACTLSYECGSKNHCDGHRCIAGPKAAKGEPCSGDVCGAGLRCVSGKCLEPKQDGEKCSRDQECLGGCAPTTHTCGMRCDAF